MDTILTIYLWCSPFGSLPGEYRKNKMKQNWDLLLQRYILWANYISENLFWPTKIIFLVCSGWPYHIPQCIQRFPWVEKVFTVVLQEFPQLPVHGAYNIITGNYTLISVPPILICSFFTEKSCWNQGSTQTDCSEIRHHPEIMWRRHWCKKLYHLGFN